MGAAAVIVAVLVLVALVVFALGLLRAASHADELADAEVVRRLRPEGNVTPIRGDDE